MAIIPLGPLTIPSIRRLLINRPGFPGGRFCSEPPPVVSLPNSGAKGSRREMFSRTATGFKAGAVAEGGRSDFATVTAADLGDFAAELGAVPEGTLPPALAAGLLVLPAPGAA